MSVISVLERSVNKTAELKFLYLVLFHILIGFLIYVFKPIAVVYALGSILYFVVRILVHSDKPIVVLEAACYIAAGEVFFRMTDGVILYETGKYAVILVILIGLYFHDFKEKVFVFIIYLLLLVPGIVVTYLSVTYDIDFRKTILFNISGPLSLFFSAAYCYKRETNLNTYLKLLDTLTLPIVAMVSYLFFYTPDLQNVVTGADANFAASGGYGPNQVSTVLGLGMFALVVRLFMPYKNLFLRYLMYAFLAFITYRALATLSRGGVFTAIVMCAFFITSYLNFSTEQAKSKHIFRLVFIGLMAVGVWFFSLTQTNNMVYNKYTNRNASGEKQGDFTTGRIDIIESELEVFAEHPVFGIGAGMGKFYRYEQTGVIKASHNEITRLLSEHGVFGLLSIFLLIGVPLTHYFSDTRNIFIIPFLAFWFLTISHSSMRIAAPGVFYGLALLSVNIRKK
jgi:hypothetical protein